MTDTPSYFTEAELEFLRGTRILGRVATVGSDGTPHVAPVGWQLTEHDGHEVIEIGGHDFDRTKKYRDVSRSGRAAIVIDEVLPPWRPRGVEVRGRAEAVTGSEPVIRIHPERIVGWGHGDGEGRHSRSV